MPSPTIAAAYARVSTLDQRDHGYSLAAQQADAKAYAAVTNPPGETVTAELPYLYSREGAHYGANLPIGEAAGRYTVAVTVRPTEQFGAHEPNREWARGAEVALTYEQPG